MPWTRRLRDRRALFLCGEEAPASCPSCRGAVERSSESFLVADRSDAKAIASGHAFFCTRCDAVALDASRICDLARRFLPGSVAPRVVGFVDLAAVPADAADMPLGVPGNPIPFVAFSRVEVLDGGSAPSARFEAPAATTGAHAARDGRERPGSAQGRTPWNVKCPCGSGRKYKKCCGERAYAAQRA